MILDGTTVENKSKLILTDGGRPTGRPRVTYEECIEEMGRKVSKSMAEKSGSLSPRTPRQ